MTEDTIPAATAASAEMFAGADGELAAAAARGEAARIAGLVRDGANPNAVNGEGKPLMLLPVESGKKDAFAALLAAGADPGLRLPNGQVVLQYLVQHRDRDYLDAALAAGADPDLRNGNDEPMIYHAAMWDRWDAVQALIEAGADVNAPAHGQERETVLAVYAAGQWDKVVWLMERGARVDFEMKNAPPGQKHRIGTKPILESIFWRDVDGDAFPGLAAQQKQAQKLALERGHEKPPEPERFR